jgi:O-antigen ligase
VAGTSARGPLVNPTLAALPALLALFAAPLLLGYQDPLPALAAAAAVWLAVLLRSALPGQPPLAPPRGRLLTVALPVLAALSLFGSANRGATVLTVLVFASQAGLLWLTADLAARGLADRVCAAVLAGALISAGLGLQEWGLHARAGDLGWRAFGPFTNQNFYAGYLAPVLLLTLGLAVCPPEGFRPAMWLLALGLVAAALGAAVMVSGSRGGLLALGAGGAGLLVLGLRQGVLRQGWAWGRLAVLGVVLAVVCAALFGSVQRRYAAMAGTAAPSELCPAPPRSEAGQSSAFRVATWRGAWNMGRARPVLGWGAGTFETAFAGHAVAGFTRHAHSTYLQLWAELGGLGALAWLALLLLAARETLRREVELWRMAAGAALATAAAHNLFDSLAYVPAIGLLLAALLGLCLAGEPPPAAPAAKGRKGQPPGARRPAPAAVLAALLLAASLWHAAGRAQVGRVEPLLAQRQWQEAADALAAAQTLLPWDHQVADLQRVAFTYLGRPQEALAAAQRALRLTPERPPAYYFLGRLREEVDDNPTLALAQYDVGLEHAPNEVQLLAARARVLERTGDRTRALEAYRRIVEVEESPVGQLPALAEVKDHRFARARAILAQDLRRRGSVDEAFRHQRAAACLLSERRALFVASPAAYQSVGEFSRQNELDLRRLEAGLWRELAPEFRRRGEPRLADLAEAEAHRAESDTEALDRIFAAAAG